MHLVTEGGDNRGFFSLIISELELVKTPSLRRIGRIRRRKRPPNSTSAVYAR